MSELSEQARALIGQAKMQGGPTAAQIASISAGVTASIAGATATAATAAAGVSWMKISGAIVASVMALTGAVIVVQLVTAPADSMVDSKVTTLAAAVEPLPTVQSIREIPQENPTETIPVPMERVEEKRKKPVVKLKQNSVPPSAVQTPESSLRIDVETPIAEAKKDEPDSTAQELKALSSALDLLKNGAAQEAKDIAESARKQFPHGPLHPELTVVEIEALCALKRVEDARNLANSMSDAERTPLVIERLKHSCLK
jgi:hypothetical protein